MKTKIVKNKRVHLFVLVVLKNDICWKQIIMKHKFRNYIERTFCQVLSPTISINHSTALVWNNIEFILIQPKQYLIIWTGFVFSFQILSYFMIPIFSLSMYVGFSNTWNFLIKIQLFKTSARPPPPPPQIRFEINQNLDTLCGFLL